MKRKIMLLCLAAALAAAVFLAYDGQELYRGDRVKDTDCYTAEFELMNQTDTHVMELNAGDMLTVEYAAEKGGLSVEIGQEGGDILFSGNEASDVSSFGLIITKDGTYRITVKAEHARGYVRIRSIKVTGETI